MPKTLSKADLILVTLALADVPNRMERGPILAKVFDEASRDFADLYGDFAWNPDYEASKRLNEALNLLDLTGMVVGDNMPTRYFRLTKQAKETYSKELLGGIEGSQLDSIKTVAERLRKSLEQVPA